MRPTPWLLAEPFRIQPPGWESRYGDDFGSFLIPHHKTHVELRCLAVREGDDLGDGRKWDHVSVSLPNRCPNWLEMCFIKDIFWAEDECVVQYHPPKENYRNLHPYCLHLWRCPSVEFIQPPPIAVAPDIERAAS